MFLRKLIQLGLILNFFSFLTAEYEVRKDVWNNPNGDDVELEIYFHPEHDFNIDIMFDAMKTSMTTFTETFSPYQYAQLRIMEFPFASFAQAFAGTVPFSENIEWPCPNTLIRRAFHTRRLWVSPSPWRTNLPIKKDNRLKD